MRSWWSSLSLSVPRVNSVSCALPYSAVLYWLGLSTQVPLAPGIEYGASQPVEK